MRYIFSLVIFCMIICSYSSSPSHTYDDSGSNYWNKQAQKTLLKRLYVQPIRGIAKNVILFLGDGLSIPTQAASRIYMAELRGSTEPEDLSFEKFPYTGLSKTYCVDRQVADSACTSTAYLCGIKANYGTMGVTEAVKRGDCQAMNNVSNHANSIIKWSQDAGKGTGIVTVTRVTHASPAGGYSHVADRYWESDSDILGDGLDPKVCHDIAKQLVYDSPGRDIKVILGGGRKMFGSKNVLDAEGVEGTRQDGEDLIKKWQVDKKRRGLKNVYVFDRDGLLKVKPWSTEYILGLFDANHMKFHLDANGTEQPSLAEMTSVAIKILQKEKNGYFLFVEGGNIDRAHHRNQARKALDETLQFQDAVQMAVKLTDEKDTLIVVTADHSHVMSFSGYPERGSDIFGIAGISDQDGIPYSKLSYANGPGYKPPGSDGKRYDVSKDDMRDINYEFPAMVPRFRETHGGDDVSVFARGPWAHLFTGVYEQNVIPHFMAFASCIGPGLTACWKE